MNYEVNYLNWFESGINQSDEPVNGVTIFKTFTEAKKYLIRLTIQHRDQVIERVNDLRRNTKEDFGIEN